MCFKELVKRYSMSVSDKNSNMPFLRNEFLKILSRNEELKI